MIDFTGIGTSKACLKPGFMGLQPRDKWEGGATSRKGKQEVGMGWLEMKFLLIHFGG